MSVLRISRRARWLALPAALGVLSAVGITQSASASRGTAAPALRFKTVTLSDEFSSDFGNPGSSVVSEIENRQGARVIGQDQTACIVIKLPDLQCTSTVGLPGGTVEVSFRQDLSASSIVAPVAGGTGRYAGAIGELELREVGTDQKTFDAVLRVNGS